MNNIVRQIKLKRVEKELLKLEALRTKSILTQKDFKDEKKVEQLTSEYYSLSNYTGY